MGFELGSGRSFGAGWRLVEVYGSEQGRIDLSVVDFGTPTRYTKAPFGRMRAAEILDFW